MFTIYNMVKCKNEYDLSVFSNGINQTITNKRAKTINVLLFAMGDKITHNY